MATNNEFSESDFIQEQYRKNPYPFWIWLFVLVILFSIAFGLQSWYRLSMQESVAKSPFLQVTNREMSLFLWQNPEFMRANVKVKSGYLPGFQYVGDVTLEEGFAEKFVVGPPEVLFRYHTWHRLLKKEIPIKAIPSEEFLEFLKKVPEWSPEGWPAAPNGYKDLVSGLDVVKEDLNSLPEAELPVDVRIAFQGWRNYYKEGIEINKTRPTYESMRKFLDKYPHYSRNYWVNLVSDNYLKGVDKGSGDRIIPDQNLSPFLKVAFYNSQK